jgi:hypothetical protein
MLCNSSLNVDVQESRRDAKVADVRVCLHGMRQQVLRGCRITFSQIMDGALKAQPDRSSLWQLATSLGAVCCDSLDAPTTSHNGSDQIDASMNGAAPDNQRNASLRREMGVEEVKGSAGTEETGQSDSMHATHVVSLSKLTDKAKRAQVLEGVKLVSPDWLLSCELKCACLAAVMIHADILLAPLLMHIVRNFYMLCTGICETDRTDLVQCAYQLKGCCICRWSKCEEKHFPVPEMPLHAWLQSLPVEDVQALRQLGQLTAQ